MSEEEKARLPHEMMEGLGLVDTSEADSDLMPGGTKRALESDEAAQGEVTEKSSTKRLATEQGAVKFRPAVRPGSLSSPPPIPLAPRPPPPLYVALWTSPRDPRRTTATATVTAHATRNIRAQNASAPPPLTSTCVRTLPSLSLARTYKPRALSRTSALMPHALLRSNKQMPHRGPHPFAHALACMDIFSRIGPRATSHGIWARARRRIRTTPDKTVRPLTTDSATLTPRVHSTPSPTGRSRDTSLGRARSNRASRPLSSRGFLALIRSILRAETAIAAHSPDSPDAAAPSGTAGGGGAIEDDRPPASHAPHGTQGRAQASDTEALFAQTPRAPRQITPGTARALSPPSRVLSFPPRARHAACANAARARAHGSSLRPLLLPSSRSNCSRATTSRARSSARAARPSPRSRRSRTVASRSVRATISSRARVRPPLGTR